MPLQNQPSPLTSLAPILLIFGIFYLLLIRPQQKKMKERDRTLNALKKGDRVLMNGGIYGTILGLKGNDLELKIAENVKVQVSRSAVSQLIQSEDSSSSS